MTRPGVAPALIREALRHTLDVGLGGQVQIIDPLTNPQPPCLVLGQPQVEYHRAMQRGLGAVEWPIWALFPSTHDLAPVDAADELQATDGERSIRRILEEDRSLGGVVQTLQVVRSLPELYPYSPAALLSVRWDVEVFA